MLYASASDVVLPNFLEFGSMDVVCIKTNINHETKESSHVNVLASTPAYNSPE